MVKKKKHTSLKLPTLDGRTYVIGDIHGTIEELSCLLDYLRKEENLAENDRVIFVGDYIDRGYHSKEVVDLLLQLRKDIPETYFLKGNHEDMFLDYLGLGGMHGSNFITNGGEQTLISYKQHIGASSKEVLASMPEDHIDFYKNLHSIIELEKNFIVHAGINPFVDLEDQSGMDLFWIRDDFIMTEHELGKTVVFGHTPFKNIFADWPYKIGIDTGLVYGNLLTCLELKERVCHQVRAGNLEVISSDLDIPIE